MNLTRLSWRIGLPFAAFVLAGSVVLVLWMSWRSVQADRARLESLAHSNADFMTRMRLPPSERIARQLAELLHVDVLFQRGEEMVPRDEVWRFPKTALEIKTMEADGALRSGVGFQHEAVKRPLHDGWNLVLWRAQTWPWSRAFDAENCAALMVFWLLALLLALAVARGLVRPLQNLAAKLPDIEKPEAIDLPEAARQDEIGDVARAFVRTREALRSERDQRGRAEKLAVLGRMTAALAHEIQNPLAAIKLHAQLMPRNGGDNSAQMIVDETARIESLVNQWMFLSRPEPPAKSDVDVRKLLEACLLNHRTQMEHAQVLSVFHAENALIIRGDHRRLTQVFANLIINAIQAMPRGGTLKVSAAKVGSMVEVSFTDTGKGFSDEALKRFAEFFYSEKEGGMGIGLSVASEIIRAHGGELLASNQAEGGARVCVKLPF